MRARLWWTWFHSSTFISESVHVLLGMSSHLCYLGKKQLLSRFLVSLAMFHDHVNRICYIQLGLTTLWVMRYFSGFIYLYIGTKGLYLQLTKSVGLEIVLQATPLSFSSADCFQYSLLSTQLALQKGECLAHKTRQKLIYLL